MQDLQQQHVEAPDDRRRRFVIASTAGFALLSAVGTGLLALLILTTLVAAAFWREQHKAWRRYSANGEVVEIITARGVERCQTCHNSSGHGAVVGGASDPHMHLRSSHNLQTQGCVACHGGDGRALRMERAHPQAGPHALVPRRLRAARCAGCHAPGAIDATRAVARGLDIYLELGCQVCHGLPAAGETGTLIAKSAPALDDSGQHDAEALWEMISQPRRAFGDAGEMPAFRAALHELKERDALLAYLLAQRDDAPMKRSSASTGPACVSCHSISRVGVGTMGSGHHTCPELRRSPRDYQCQRCHQPLPSGLGVCAFVDGQRFRCQGCHYLSEPKP